MNLRSVRTEETEEAAALEQKCFPPNEACAPQFMKKGFRLHQRFFWWRQTEKTEKSQDFLMGFATEEKHLRDEVFTDASPS